MKLLSSCTLFATLTLSAALAAQTADPKATPPPAAPTKARSAEAPSQRALVDELSEADLDQVQALIKTQSTLGGKLTELEIKRATVQGLLHRLGSAVSLQGAAESAAPEPSPFHAEVLENRVGYLRLGSISTTTASSLDSALKEFAEKGASSAILDLRASTGAADYNVAADICRRFSPKGKPLFTVRRSGAKDQAYTSTAEPQFHGILVALIASSTSGTAEIVAGALRNAADAMLIGAKTKGEAAELKVAPLSNGRSLRIATSEVAVGNNLALDAGGLRPDLAVSMTPEAMAQALKLEAEKGVQAAVLEVERPKLNEAALVAGTNPELEAPAPRARGDKARPPQEDTALQRALDFITTLAIYEQGRGK